MTSCDCCTDVEIACSLDPSSLAERRIEWQQIQHLARSLVPIDEGVAATFDASPLLASRLADLIVREQQCCPFFSFRLIVDGGTTITLEVRAPAQARSLVEELLGAAS